METTSLLDRQSTRAERLKQATSALHERLDTGIVARRPFLDRERYALFVGVQYRFYAAIEPLYHSGYHAEIFADLGGRSRLDAARMDLDDLGIAAPSVLALAIPRHEGIGWLYVSEGSTLGAAFLLKAIQAMGLDESFGGRHLAASPLGRGRHWRDFTEALNGLDLPPDEDAEVVSGAVAAFGYVENLVTIAYG